MAFDPYETWLGIPADHRPPTYYDLLGLAPEEPDPAAIEKAALRRMGHVRLHHIGPHSDLSQEILAELARARLVLMDPDRRSDYDAKLRARCESSPGAPAAVTKVGNGDAHRRQPRPDEDVAGELGSLVLIGQEGDGSLSVSSALDEGTPWWKKGAILGAIVASHALVLGAFAFIFWGSSSSKPKETELAQSGPHPSNSAPKPQRNTPPPLTSTPVLIPKPAPRLIVEPPRADPPGGGSGQTSPDVASHDENDKRVDGSASLEQAKPTEMRADPRESISLFNGKDMSGWKAFRGESTISPKDISFIEGEDLVCAPDKDKWGRLVTELGYSTFSLTLQYQSSDDLADTGVQLLTASEDPAQWSGVEFNIRKGSTGGVYATLGLIKGSKRRLEWGCDYFPSGAGAERPKGKWNDCEIRCASDKLTVRLNGMVVNQLDSIWQGPWQVGLKATGTKAVRFRNIRLAALGGPAVSVVIVRPPFAARKAEKTVPKPARTEWDKLVVKTGVEAMDRWGDPNRWRCLPGLVLRQENGILCAQKAFGREGVICTSPFDGETPATIDFSKITKEKAGQINLTVKSFPSVGPGGRIEIKVGGVATSIVDIGADDPWKTIPIVFDHKDVVVAHHPLWWNCEGMFFDYAIQANPTEPKDPVTQKGNHQPEEMKKTAKPAGSKQDKNKHQAAAKAVIAFETAAQLDPKKLVGPLLGHKQPVFRVAFSPDGRWLASGGEDGQVIIWDINAGQDFRHLKRERWVRGLEFAPLTEGPVLISGRSHFDGRVTFENLNNGETIDFEIREGWTWRSFAIDRLCRFLAAADNRTLRVWIINNRVDVRREGDRVLPVFFEFTSPLALPDEILCIAFRPNATKPQIAVGCRNGAVGLFHIENDFANGIQPASVKIVGHSGTVNCVKYNPDGSLLATAGEDGTIRLWDAKGQGQQVRLISASARPVNWLDFSPGGRFLASAHDDNTVRIWDMRAQGEPKVLTDHTEPVMGVAISFDGRLASCSRDLGVIVYSLYPNAPGRLKKGRGK